MKNYTVPLQINGQIDVSIPDNTLRDIDLPDDTIKEMVTDAAAIKVLLPDEIYERLKSEGSVTPTGVHGDHFITIIENIQLKKMDSQLTKGMPVTVDFENL